MPSGLYFGLILHIAPDPRPGFQGPAIQLAHLLVVRSGAGTNEGLDVAWLLPPPSIYVRTSSAKSGIPTQGGYSVDGGYNFTAFPTQPPRAGQTPIAISADGKAIVWVGHRSIDRGSTWVACAGLPAGSGRSGVDAVADRANARVFYAQADGYLYVSIDYAATFRKASSLADGVSNKIRAVFGQAGALLVPTNSGVLLLEDYGASTRKLPGVETAYSVSVGKAAPDGDGFPAVFVHGVMGGVEGFYRSDDRKHWVRVNDALHKFGYVMFIMGDTRTFGRMFVATNGRGILVGERTA